MGFAIDYAYNSGKIENDAITLHDTKEVFERGGVSSFTGEVRTLFEIESLRVSWNWMLERLSPVLVPEGDCMAYDGALDAFHYEDELQPLEEFLTVESLRVWETK